MKTEIFSDKVPQCTSCDGGVVKPNIIFFGENLPGKISLSLKFVFYCSFFTNPRAVRRKSCFYFQFKVVVFLIFEGVKLEVSKFEGVNTLLPPNLNSMLV